MWFAKINWIVMVDGDGWIVEDVIVIILLIMATQLHNNALHSNCRPNFMFKAQKQH